MPFLFREIEFCECGRPALAGRCECRTCYEDGLRRVWRDELRGAVDGVPAAPVKRIAPRLRPLFAPSFASLFAEQE